MVDIAVLLGADRARAEVELKDSLQFEMKLANVSSIKKHFYDKADTIVKDRVPAQHYEMSRDFVKWASFCYLHTSYTKDFP